MNLIPQLLLILSGSLNFFAGLLYLSWGLFGWGAASMLMVVVTLTISVGHSIMEDRKRDEERKKSHADGE